jgi:cell shape-determining protein MreC
MLANLSRYKLKKWIKAYGKYVRLSIFLFIIYISLYSVANNIAPKYIYLTIQYLKNEISNSKQYFNDAKFYFEYLVNRKNTAYIEHEKLLELEARTKEALLEKQILENENIELKKLLNFVEKNELDIVSTKAFINHNNTFSNFGIVYTNGINVKKNDFVLGNNGLLGIIYEIGTDFARFNLITNPDVRISVINVNSRDTCMTLGFGSKLKLIYVNDRHSMKIGDILVTNSENLKYGIPVAIVESIKDNEIYATPISDIINLDFVSIVVNKHE